MGQISLQIPQSGALNSSEDPKVAGDFNTLQTLVNGNIDATNIAAGLAQSAQVNQGGQVVKGAVNNAGPGTRTNVAYGALNDAADQVTGIVLPSNGLIAVWFQATWQESISGAARAAIFLGANQLKVAVPNTNVPSFEAAATSGNGGALNCNLFSCPIGLVSSLGPFSYAGDVTTGQAVGFMWAGANPSGNVFAYEGGGNVNWGNNDTPTGGPCYIFAAAGTYTVSVQYKASSGTVTASNRRLWVQALSFA